MVGTWTRLEACGRGAGNFPETCSRRVRRSLLGPGACPSGGFPSVIPSLFKAPAPGEAFQYPPVWWPHPPHRQQRRGLLHAATAAAGNLVPLTQWPFSTVHIAGTALVGKKVDTRPCRRSTSRAGGRGSAPGQGSEGAAVHLPPHLPHGPIMHLTCSEAQECGTWGRG